MKVTHTFLTGTISISTGCSWFHVVLVFFVVGMGMALDPFLVGECVGLRGPVRVQCVSTGGVAGDHTGADT